MGHAAKLSPFAPAALPEVTPIAGVRFATAEAGIRYRGRTDLLVAVLDAGTIAAGVTTRSKTCSAPVLWCRENLAAGARARVLVVNSGNANAFTGAKGRQAVAITAAAAAKAVECREQEVYLASTGVIGEPLDAAKFAHLIEGMVGAARPDAWAAAARAIMTTDTYPKLVTRRVVLGPGHDSVGIAGFCKGAGMIAPDMATMLGFLFTDAPIRQDLLQRLLAAHAETTFNCMTVDGDTSTSDTLLMFATGRAQVDPINTLADPRAVAFGAALHELLRELAIMVAKDGEGISKFVTFEVTGAESWAAARTIARACANSPILKTAIAGEDPNWGRVVMAVGKSGEAADRDRLAIWFGPHCVAREGERAAEYDEATVAAYMRGPEITIRIDVGVGIHAATVWTCDLTHEYVAINADYRS